jgi:hypothetical protein
MPNKNKIAITSLTAIIAFETEQILLSIKHQNSNAITNEKVIQHFKNIAQHLETINAQVLEA